MEVIKIKTVKDIMSKGVVSVRTTNSVAEAIKILRDNHISGAPVLDEENELKGIISEYDILKLIEYKPFLAPFLELLEEHPDDILNAVRLASKKSVGEVMSKPPITVNPDTSVSEAALLMWDKKVNRLPVVDKNGNLVGIIARADLLKAFYE